MSAGVLGYEDLQMSAAALCFDCSPKKVTSAFLQSERPRSQLSADAPEFQYSDPLAAQRCGSTSNGYDINNHWGNNDARTDWSALLPELGFDSLAAFGHAGIWGGGFFPPSSLEGFGLGIDAPLSPAAVPPPGVFYSRHLSATCEAFDHTSEPSTDVELPADPPPGLPPPGLNFLAAAAAGGFPAAAAAAVAVAEAVLTPRKGGETSAEDLSPRSDSGPFRFTALEDTSGEPVAKESMTLTLDEGGRGCWADWVVRGQRLKSMDKQAVSPVFKIKFPKRGPTSFKIMICPAARNDGRGGGSFKQGKGKGRVGLKCTEELEAGTEVCLKYWVVVGEGALASPARGPFEHNFAEHSCSEFGGQEAWNFAAAVDLKDTFVVRFMFEAADPAQAEPTGSVL